MNTQFEEVTVDRAKEIINSDRFVNIIWFNEVCPTCQHMMPILEKVKEQVPEFTFAAIKIKETDKLYFEPNSFPASYFFKDGDRISMIFGAGVESEVIQFHKDIVNGGIKTEQEQLDLLD
jgi:thioredoxin-like negative regulator of GroEL